MAVLKNMARMVGAGPLMVIDTEVAGSHRSKPANRAHVVEGGDRHPRGADLAVDVGPGVGVEPVERHRVEGRGQPGGRLAGGQQVEPPVGPEGVALAGEHAGRLLAVALEREDPGGEGEAARAGSRSAARPPGPRGRPMRGRATRGTRVPESEVRRSAAAVAGRVAVGRRPG